jgi:hypothetical protein
MPNFKLVFEENVDVVFDLKTVILHFNMNRLLKLSSAKKIVRNRYLKEYGKSPIFEDEVALPYLDDMKIEMFSGNPIGGYLLDQKLLTVKVNYVGGSVEVPVKNYKTFKGFANKMCRMYGLGNDVIVTD